MENLQINLQIPVLWANLVLTALAKLPLEQVNDAYHAIKAQAQAQIDAAVTKVPAPAEPAQD